MQDGLRDSVPDAYQALTPSIEVLDKPDRALLAESGRLKPPQTYFGNGWNIVRGMRRQLVPLSDVVICSRRCFGSCAKAARP